MKKFFILFGFLLLAQNCFAQGALDLGQINVLASRTSVLASDISKGVTIITRQDIEKSTATTVHELVVQQVGITSADYYNTPKGAKIDMRGFGDSSNQNILVLVDGRRTNQVDLSGVDWGQISLDSVERIEILRGASTVLYGDNASAGVINIVTKKGYGKGEAPLRIGTEFGSYQYKKGFVSTGGKFKFIDYFFNYTHHETSGYRANSDYWANDYLGNLNFYPTDKFSVDMSLGYHRDKYHTPGALFLSEGIDRSGVRPQNDGDRAWTSDFFVNFEPQVDFSIGDSDAIFSWFHSYRKRLTKALWPNTPWETIHQINSFELKPKLQIKSNIRDNVVNNFTAGYDYFYAKDKIRSGIVGAAQDFVDIVKNTHGFYALDEAEFNDWLLINIGGRAIWAGYDFIQTAQSRQKEKKSIVDGAMNFGFGLKYNEESQVYFDYSRSVRLPATDEYFDTWNGLNTTLKHQTAHNWEWGIRDVSLPWLFANINFFMMDVSNEIYYDSVDPMNARNANYSPLTRHYGVEFESKGDFFDGFFKPFMNWTWQDAYFKGGDYTQEKVPLVPNNKISAGMTLDFFKCLDTTISMNYIGKRFAANDLENIYPKLNSYITFDFKTEYKHKNFKVWFACRNMFGRKYNSSGGYSSSKDEVGYYPAPERNFLGGISFEF